MLGAFEGEQRASRKQASERKQGGRGGACRLGWILIFYFDDILGSQSALKWPLRASVLDLIAKERKSET